jgi:hypothetical protein
MNLLDIINKHVNLAFDRRIKSLTKYEREFLHRLLDDYGDIFNMDNKGHMIEVIKDIKKLGITKNNLDLTYITTRIKV